MEPTAPLAVMAAVLLWLIVKVGFVGCAVGLAVTHPKLVPELQQAYSKQRSRCYIFGIVNGLLLSVIGLILLSTQALALLGLLVFTALLMAAIAGYTAGYADLGERICGMRNPYSRIRVVMAGGILAECAFLAPLVGQALSLMMLLRGLGALTIVVQARRRASAAVAKKPEESPTAD